MSATLNLGTDGQWATKENSLLGYNSESGNYKPLPFDFTRASNGTFVNKSGLIETAANGVPRIDFSDSTSGALLLEPQRTNIFDYSSDLSAWSKLNSTVSESNVLSLDGVNNSYGYERTSSSSSYIYRRVSLANTTQYTLSFFVKSGTSTNVRVDIWDTAQSVQGQIQVDLETKAVSNFDGTSYKIEDYTNGWMRVSVVFTSESSFGTTFNRYFNIDGVGSELYIWGAQLEQGSYATSLINTQGSAVTRVADVCSQTPPSGIIGQTEGTVFLDSKMALQSINNYQLFSINNGGGSDRIRILTATGNRLRFIYQLNGGVLAYSFYNPTDYSDLTSLKIAFTYKSGDIKVYINGVLTDSSANTFTIAQTLTNIDIASSAGGYNQMLFNDIKLYNTALTDAELIALTS